MTEKRLTERLTALRNEFDAAFAAPRDAGSGEDQILFLEIIPGAGSSTHLVPLRGLRGIGRAAAVVEVKSSTPAFAGLTAWKFRPCPVYALEVALESARSNSNLPWHFFHETWGPVAFAVHEIRGVHRSSAKDIRGVRPDDPWSQYVTKVARRNSENLPVIDIDAIVGFLTRIDPSAAPVPAGSKEGAP